MEDRFGRQIIAWFEEFHAIPEVSWKEFKTTDRIAEILDMLGVSYHRFPDVTGLIAEMGEGEEVIAFRADIDALWQEVDGVWQGNHSCGHDAHISIVLGSMLYLQGKHVNKRIRFIFQPAEEKGNGSIAMMERGAMEKVTHLFGVHLRPKEELPLGKIAPSIHHGAGIFLEGEILGIDAHGARPHQGKNAIDVMAALHQMIKSIYVSPFESHSVKLTKMIAGGESINIIPGKGAFALDVRAQKNEVLDELKGRIEQALDGLQKLYQVDIQWNWLDYTPGAKVSKETETIAEQAIRHIAGEDAVAPPVITSGSDDFHFYTIKYPDVKAAMIGIGADLQPGLHHPKMKFDKSILDVGARILADIALKA
jgi:amidohydrolase